MEGRYQGLGFKRHQEKSNSTPYGHWKMILSLTESEPKPETLRATSQTRLRARDHFTSSTLIGEKGGAGPSEYKMDVKSTYRKTVAGLSPGE